MLAEELTLGMRVRYPRTGTTGTILRIERVRGEVFAELDSTLIDDAKKVIEREKEFAQGRELQDAWKATDQSCEGGG
jgi:hypothetical protein